MSSCKKRALPALASHKKCSVAPSTDPSSTVVAMVSTSVRASACSSMSAAGPSFHSATIESGAGSPLRSVNTTDATPFVTSRWTSAADASSSRCASSTPRSSRPSRSPCWSARTIAPSVASRPRPIDSLGTRCATAPSGTAAAACVATTHSVRSCSRAPVVMTSRRDGSSRHRRDRSAQRCHSPRARNSRARSRRHDRPGASRSDREHRRPGARDPSSVLPPTCLFGHACILRRRELDQGRERAGVDAQARRDVLRSDVLGEPRHDPLVRRRQPEDGLVTVHTSRMTDDAPGVMSRRLLTPRTAPAGCENPRKHLVGGRARVLRWARPGRARWTHGGSRT